MPQRRSHHPNRNVSLRIETLISPELLLRNCNIYDLVKAGYPPHSLTLIPELPLESLGLKQGEQLIVSQKAGAAPASPSRPGQTASTTRSPPLSSPPRSSTRQQPPSSPTNASGPDHVPVDGGYLVHRVSDYFPIDVVFYTQCCVFTFARRSCLMITRVSFPPLRWCSSRIFGRPPKSGEVSPGLCWRILRG